MAVQRGQIAREESDWPQLKDGVALIFYRVLRSLCESVYVRVDEGACLEAKDNLGKAVYLLRDRPFLVPEITSLSRLAD